jgi:hypothetical protein
MKRQHKSVTPSKPSNADILDHSDAVYTHAADIMALGSLLEAINDLTHGDVGFSHTAVFEGMGAIGRIIEEKAGYVTEHADKLRSAAEAARRS